MNDRELLKKARKGWELGSDCSIPDLFDRFEQILDDKEPKSIVWKPKKGKKYYFVGSDGTVQLTDWRGDQLDMELLKHHNVYKTREQAEKAAQYQSRYNMVLQAVINLEPDQVVYWNTNQLKYQLEFDHKTGCWYRKGWYRLEHGYPVLTDKKNVQPLVDYLNAKEKENG